MTVTLTDFFAGAGGTSQGAAAVADVDLVMARALDLTRTPTPVGVGWAWLGRAGAAGSLVGVRRRRGTRALCRFMLEGPGQVLITSRNPA